MIQLRAIGCELLGEHLATAVLHTRPWLPSGWGCVGVGVLPEGEEVLVCLAGSGVCSIGFRGLKSGTAVRTHAPSPLLSSSSKPDHCVRGSSGIRLPPSGSRAIEIGGEFHLVMGIAYGRTAAAGGAELHAAADRNSSSAAIEALLASLSSVRRHQSKRRPKVRRRLRATSSDQHSFTATCRRSSTPDSYRLCPCTRPLADRDRAGGSCLPDRCSHDTP